MQIELSPEAEKALKELIEARKKEMADYDSSMTVVANAMILAGVAFRLKKEGKQCCR